MHFYTQQPRFYAGVDRYDPGKKFTLAHPSAVRALDLRGHKAVRDLTVLLSRKAVIPAPPASCAASRRVAKSP
jgi:hypothetical protein